MVAFTCAGVVNGRPNPVATSHCPKRAPSADADHAPLDRGQGCLQACAERHSPPRMCRPGPHGKWARRWRWGPSAMKSLMQSAEKAWTRQSQFDVARRVRDAPENAASSCLLRPQGRIALARIERFRDGFRERPIHNCSGLACIGSHRCGACPIGCRRGL